jgi:hypothetical protein
MRTFTEKPLRTIREHSLYELGGEEGEETYYEKKLLRKEKALQYETKKLFL